MTSKIMSSGMLLALALAVPTSAAVLYTNGPINGTVDGWNITSFVVSDSFTLSSASTVTGVDFGAWNFSGETTTAVDWAITDTEDSTGSAGTVFGSGSGATVTSVSQFTNTYGYQINQDSFTIPALDLAAGTYYLTLQNAVATNGDQVYWDENDGPSLAFEAGGELTIANACGNGNQSPNQTTDCSEAFDILGTSGPSVPEPASLALLGLGLAGIGAIRRRRRG